MMEKPISLRVQEFKENLVKDINNSGLIPIIIEPILKDMYEQVVNLKEQQYEKDKQEYDNYLKQKNNKEKEENNG